MESKPEYQKKTIKLLQLTDKLYLVNFVTVVTSGNPKTQLGNVWYQKG